MAYSNFNAKDKFLYKTYNKTLIDFLGIKEGSDIIRENRIYKVKKITPECSLSLTLIEPLKTSGLPSKANCCVNFMSVKTINGKSVLIARNSRKFKALWKRKKPQAEKDWKKLQQEKLEALRGDPTISFENNH